MDKEIFEILKNIDGPILETILVDTVKDFCINEDNNEYVKKYIELLESGIKDDEIDQEFDNFISEYFLNTINIYESAGFVIPDNIKTEDINESTFTIKNLFGKTTDIGKKFVEALKNGSEKSKQSIAKTGSAITAGAATVLHKTGSKLKNVATKLENKA